MDHKTTTEQNVREKRKEQNETKQFRTQDATK